MEALSLKACLRLAASGTPFLDVHPLLPWLNDLTRDGAFLARFTVNPDKTKRLDWHSGIRIHLRSLQIQ